MSSSKASPGGQTARLNALMGSLGITRLSIFPGTSATASAEAIAGEVADSLERLMAGEVSEVPMSAID